jgi:hypothetical protein
VTHRGRAAVLATAAGRAAGSGAGTVSGTVANISGLTVRVKVGSAGHGSVSAMLATAERIAAKNYPYVYGGGHAHAGSASRASRGGALGFDCSGAVAAVLAAGGLWPHGGPVPSDTGIIAELRHRGLVSDGAGRGPDEVTLYDIPGHIMMSLAGLPWGTGANRRGGAGFLPTVIGGRHVTVVHVDPDRVHQRGLPALLGLTAPQSTAGSLTLDGLSDGVKVLAGYSPGASGKLTLGQVSFPGSLSASGVLAGFSADGEALHLQRTGGTILTLSLPPDPSSQVFTGPDGAPSGPLSLAAGLSIGQTLSVTYTKGPRGSLVLRRRRVLATPPRESMTGILTGQSASAQTVSVEDDANNQVTTFAVPPGVGGGRRGAPFAGVANGCALRVAYDASVDGLPPSLISVRFLKQWAAPPGFRPAPGIKAYGACFR